MDDGERIGQLLAAVRFGVCATTALFSKMKAVGRGGIGAKN
jgi:hypothetical protein